MFGLVAVDVHPGGTPPGPDVDPLDVEPEVEPLDVEPPDVVIVVTVRGPLDGAAPVGVVVVVPVVVEPDVVPVTIPVAVVIVGLANTAFVGAVYTNCVSPRINPDGLFVATGVLAVTT